MQSNLICHLLTLPHPGPSPRLNILSRLTVQSYSPILEIIIWPRVFAGNQNGKMYLILCLLIYHHWAPLQRPFVLPTTSQTESSSSSPNRFYSRIAQIYSVSYLLSLSHSQSPVCCLELRLDWEAQLCSQHPPASTFPQQGEVPLSASSPPLMVWNIVHGKFSWVPTYSRNVCWQINKIVSWSPVDTGIFLPPGFVSHCVWIIWSL